MFICFFYVRIFSQHIFSKSITLMMEAASTSETSVKFHQTTRRNNPEDSHLHTRRRENLKFHIIGFVRI
jgi:hypothetical protein